MLEENRWIYTIYVTVQEDISQNHEVKMDYARRGGNETNTKKEGAVFVN